MNHNVAVGRHRRADIDDSGFRLLFVCTGNICRSPFAEILTRHLLTQRLGGPVAARFDVASAGVHAVVGAAMHAQSRAQLAPWGLHGDAADRFVARQLRSAMATSAHLVLGASPEHRSAVVGRAPATLATAFALTEFARLVAAVDPGDLPSDPVAPAPPPRDEAPAPPGRALIRGAVQRIVDVIAPDRPSDCSR